MYSLSFYVRKIDNSIIFSTISSVNCTVWLMYMIGPPWLQFPSMSSLQGALPSVTPSVHPSNMGNLSHAWNPPSSSSYAPMLPPQAQTLASAMGPSIPFIIFSIIFLPRLFALYLCPNPCKNLRGIRGATNANKRVNAKVTIP